MRGYRVPLPLLAFVTCLAMAAPLPVMAQGMRSATDPASAVSATVREPLRSSQPAVSADRQVATVQRLLRRLGYLNDGDMSRQMDNVTKFATTLFLADIKRPPTIPDIRNPDAVVVQHHLGEGRLGAPARPRARNWWSSLQRCGLRRRHLPS